MPWPVATPPAMVLPYIPQPTTPTPLQDSSWVTSVGTFRAYLVMVEGELTPSTATIFVTAAGNYYLALYTERGRKIWQSLGTAGGSGPVAMSLPSVRLPAGLYYIAYRSIAGSAVGWLITGATLPAQFEQRAINLVMPVLQLTTDLLGNDTFPDTIDPTATQETDTNVLGPVVRFD